jgi:hypothetical protein
MITMIGADQSVKKNAPEYKAPLELTHFSFPIIWYLELIHEKFTNISFRNSEMLN